MATLPAPWGANNPVTQAGKHGKYQEALRRLAKSVDKSKDTGGILGGIGTAGNIASLALAPFTGGASLAAGPLITAGAQMGAGALLPGVSKKAQKEVEKTRAEIQMAHPFSQAPGLGAVNYAAGAGGGEQALAKASKGYEAAQEVADILNTTSKVLSGVNTALSLGSTALASSAAEKGVEEAAKVGSKEAAQKVATEGTAQAGTKMAEAAAKGATQIQSAAPQIAPTVAAADIATGVAPPGVGVPPPGGTPGFTPPSTPGEFVEFFKGGPTETAANIRSELLGGPIGTAPPAPGMGSALGVLPPVVPVASTAPNLVDKSGGLGITGAGPAGPSPAFAKYVQGGDASVLGTQSGFAQPAGLGLSEASTLTGEIIPPSLPVAGVAGQDPGLMNYADKLFGDVQQAIPGWRHVWRAGQGLTPAAPAFTEFVDDASDFGRQIPLLRRLLSRSGNPARLY